MAEHYAGAGADDDRHARDDSESGKQAAPDAPFRKAKAFEPGFADAESKRHYLPLNPKVKVRRQYRGTRLTSREAGWISETSIPQKQKGRRDAGLSVESGSGLDPYQYLPTTGP